MQVRIEKSWKKVLEKEFEKPYFKTLVEFVKNAYQTQQVFPPASLIFNAFDSTPFHLVKVVIIGQDPYHNIGQAHGLSFSVPKGIKTPPSLNNIFKEIERSLQKPIPHDGDLTHWAKQGVLLLNATLTVQAHCAGSHQGKGWETFTDSVIQRLSDQRQNIVFILWGSYAQRKSALIDTNKHHILKSVHPSPLSAHRGFIGNNHFAQTNDYLQSKGVSPIIW